MAMAKCRECGTEVSDAAKTCPKCGISKPVKRTSVLVKIFGVVVVLGLVGKVMSGTGDVNSTSTQAAPATPARPTEDDLAKNVNVKDFKWRIDGFGTVMMLTKVVIENKNNEAVKDFEIECEHKGPSGTTIDQSKKVIYQILPAGKSTTLKEINMGLIHSQVTSSGCQVVSVTRV